MRRTANILLWAFASVPIFYIAIFSLGVTVSPEILYMFAPLFVFAQQILVLMLLCFVVGLELRRFFEQYKAALRQRPLLAWGCWVAIVIGLCVTLLRPELLVTVSVHTANYALIAGVSMIWAGTYLLRLSGTQFLPFAARRSRFEKL